MPLVESFEEACQYLGIDPKKAVPDLSHLPKKISRRNEATIKLDIINEAIRDKKPLNWQAITEKWRGWFDLEKHVNNPTGFRLVGAYCGYTHTGAGARLSFHTEEQFLHSFNKFKPLWKIVIKG